jgi:hypothetical protein
LPWVNKPGEIAQKVRNFDLWMRPKMASALPFRHIIFVCAHFFKNAISMYAPAEIKLSKCIEFTSICRLLATNGRRFVAFRAAKVGHVRQACENVNSFQSSEVSGRNFR